MPDVQSLRLERRDVTQDAGEVLAPFLRSEASGDLTLDTPRAYIAFGVVVVKGDAFIVEEVQHRLAVLLAPQGQITSGCLPLGQNRPPAGAWPLRSAPSTRDRGCWGIRHQCGVQQSTEPVFKSPHDFGGDRPILLLVAHQAQRVSQLTRPHLSVRLGQTAQFAQQMCPAQRVFRGELEIHAPGVVHQEALELWQDIHGLLLPLVALQNLPGPLASLVSRTPFQGAVPVSSRPRWLSPMRSDAWPPYSILKGRSLRSEIYPGNANRPDTLPEPGRHQALTWAGSMLGA
jgi:hypothetical protein